MLNENPENKLSIIYMFSYKSKCTDVKNAVIQLNLLHIKLLDENYLEISHPQVVKIPIDTFFEILISWEFKVNNPEILGKVVDQLNAFTVFLDTISET